MIYTNCPCCGQDDRCYEECTLRDDAPEAYENMEQVRKLYARIEELEAENDSLKETSEELRSTLSAANKTCIRRREKIAALEAENAALKAERDNLVADLHEMGTSTVTIASVVGMRNELAALKADRLSLAVSVKHPVHKYMKWCDCVQCGTARRVIAEAAKEEPCTTD